MFTAVLYTANSTVMLSWPEWQMIGGVTGNMNSQWTAIMAEKVEEVNPFCSLAFKNHWRKRQPSQKGSNYCFRADACCTFSGCPIKCTLKVEAYNSNCPPTELPPTELSPHLVFSNKYYSQGKWTKSSTHKEYSEARSWEGFGAHVCSFVRINYRPTQC